MGARGLSANLPQYGAWAYSAGLGAAMPTAALDHQANSCPQLCHASRSRLAAVMHCVIHPHAGSEAGVQQVVAGKGAALRALVGWAGSPEPILQRYGTGGLARVVGSSASAAAAVAAGGGLAALVRGLGSADAQSQCFAAAGLGRMVGQGGSCAAALAQEPGLAAALAALVSGPAESRVSTGQHPQQQQGSSRSRSAPASSRPATGQSPGVRRGVQLCALRSVVACAGERKHLRPLLVKAGMADVLTVSYLCSSCWANCCTGPPCCDTRADHLCASRLSSLASPCLASESACLPARSHVSRRRWPLCS